MSEIANAHTADCLTQAAYHLKEAITLLLCADVDEVESIAHVLRPVIRQVEGMAKVD